jgi:hypothetical protein
MGIRDREIERIVKYAEGLGLTVEWHKSGYGDPGASWVREDQKIHIYTYPRMTKTITILNFLHELGHHMDWIYSNQEISVETEQAYQLEDARIPYKSPPIPKEQRKLIYDSERAGIKYMINIARELNLKLKEDRILEEMELDTYIYYVYYITGDNPRVKDVDAKRIELRKNRKRKS